MTTPFIRTVLGDIDPSTLGACNAHDHVLMTPSRGATPFQDVDEAIAEIKLMVDAGGGAVVDMAPLGLGRNIEGLQAVSRALSVNVLAATGLLRTVSYPEDSPYRQRSVESLADEFTSDLEGQCGIIKLGADYHHISEWSRRAFDAAAIANGRTGAPIAIHTEHGSHLLEIIEYLGDRGVAASSVLLQHVDRNPDPVYLAEAAATGAYLEFDGPSRSKYWPDSVIIDLIEGVAGRGQLSQIIIGGDNGKRDYRRSIGGGPGMDYIFRVFKPRLARELGAEVVDAIYVTNPSRALAFQSR